MKPFLRKSRAGKPATTRTACLRRRKRLPKQPPGALGGDREATSPGADVNHLVYLHSFDAAIVIRVTSGGFLLEDANPQAQEILLGGGRFFYGQGSLPPITLDPEASASVACLVEACECCLRTTLPVAYDGSLSLSGETSARIFRIHLNPLADDNGITRIIVIGHDITVARAHEAALLQRAETEARMSSYFHSAPGDFFTIACNANGEWSLVFASPGLAATLESSGCADFQHPVQLLRLLHPECTVRVEAELFAAQRDFRPAVIECRLAERGDGERWIELRCTPRVFADGAVAWDGVVLDISARKKIEAALTVSERAYRALTENAPDPILRMDSSGAILYANPAARAQLRSILQRGSRIYEFSENALRKARETSGVFEAVSERGEPRHFQCRAVPEMDESGKPLSALLIARDVTEMKESARRLAESSEQLRLLVNHGDAIREEERRRLARDIHEELGQLLTSMHLGLSSLALEFGEMLPGLGKKVGDLLALVQISLRSTRELVSSLRPMALNSGIESGLVWLAENFFRYNQVRPKLQITPNTKGLTENQATALFRIAQEALTNIARHAAASKVSLTLRREAGYWCFEVCDNGKGFDVSGRSANRFGLLGISERVVALGGHAEVVSEPGRGTQVLVRIPFA